MLTFDGEKLPEGGLTSPKPGWFNDSLAQDLTPRTSALQFFSMVKWSI